MCAKRAPTSPETCRFQLEATWLHKPLPLWQAAGGRIEGFVGPVSGSPFTEPPSAGADSRRRRECILLAPAPFLRRRGRYHLGMAHATKLTDSEVERRRAAADRMRGLFADVAPDRSLVDELIADRRAEVKAEDRETRGPRAGR